MQQTKHPSAKRYPPEVRERAVELVLSAFKSSGERYGHVTRIANQFGIGPETLRKWVRQAEIDRGLRGGVTSTEHQRVQELEREVRELRRTNEIFKAASAFFARELDPRTSR